MFYFNKICIDFSFLRKYCTFYRCSRNYSYFGVVHQSWYFLDGTELINAVAEPVYTNWKVRVTPPGVHSGLFS